MQAMLDIPPRDKRNCLAISLVVLVAWLLPLTVAASGDPARGGQTVEEVCSMCHGSGLLGAPMIGDQSAWSKRLQNAGSVDALVASAANGRGNMPPRGGRPALSDTDLKAALQYMLVKSGIAQTNN